MNSRKDVAGSVTLIPLVTFAAFCSNFLSFSGVAVGLIWWRDLGRMNSRKDVAGSNNPDPLSYLCCLLFKFSPVLQWSWRGVDFWCRDLGRMNSRKDVAGSVTLIPLVTFAAFCSNSLLCFSGVAVGLILM